MINKIVSTAFILFLNFSLSITFAQTTVVAILQDNSAIIGADSKVQSTDLFMDKDISCKIVKIKNCFCAFSGYTKFGDFKLINYIKEAFSKDTTFWEKVKRYDQLMSELLPLHLKNLKIDYPQDYNKISNSKIIIGTLFVGTVDSTLFMIATKYQIITGKIVKQISRDTLPDKFSNQGLLSIGHNEQISNYLRINKSLQDWKNPHFIDFLIDLEIKKNPDEVNYPIDLIQIKSNSYKWITRKNYCYIYDSL